MISYDLRCANGHVFSSDFPNMGTYDALKAAGQLICAHCDSREIEKAPMAPAIVSGRPSSTPTARDVEAIREKIWAHVEANSTNVGGDFPEAVRAGEAPIHGVTTVDQALDLVSEGYRIFPLPPRPAGHGEKAAIDKKALN